MGVSPIPYEAISNYALRYQIEGEDFEELLHVIVAMDDVQMKIEQAKQPKQK